MFLIFTRSSPAGKRYAQTPAGEYAFADAQGLYEWRDGKCIHHTGGSSGGQPHSLGSGKWWVDSGTHGWLIAGPQLAG